jgi:uncharacterized membrane protein YfcA
MDWHYSASGLLVGTVVGMTGVGGGSLMTPLLVLGFGIAPVTAIGTDLLYAGFTKAGGTAVRGRLGSVNWRVAGLMALGSVPAAVGTGALLAATLKRGYHGAALLLTALSLACKERMRGLHTRTPGWIQHLRAHHAGPLTVALGAVLGTLVTLTSVGAGALGVVALLLLYPTLSSNHIAGTDIVHAVPLTLIAGAAYAVAGSVNYQLLASLLIGSLPGVVVGSVLGHRMPERLLRYALATVLCLVGLKLVL